MSAILSRTSTETLRLALSGFIWVLKNDSIAKLRWRCLSRGMLQLTRYGNWTWGSHIRCLRKHKSLPIRYLMTHWEVPVPRPQV